MKPKHILFDLDGTLTDSGPGIINCAVATFREYGVPIPSDEALRTIIGPPLRDSLIRFGLPEDKAIEAVAFFRSIYAVTGKYENTPYPGIHQLLKKLKADGHRLYVATSKPEHMAVDILDHFDLAQYFDLVCGADMNHLRGTKEAVIQHLLDQIGTLDRAIMVGDTVFDVEGAAIHHIPTVCVSWGYGNREDMLTAGAIGIADGMDELYELIVH